MLGAEHDPPKVDAHDALVVIEVELGERPRAPDAGDVQHGVDAPEVLDGCREHGLDVGFVGDVDVERGDGFAELGGRVLLGPADVGSQHQIVLVAHREEAFARGHAPDNHLAKLRAQAAARQQQRAVPAELQYVGHTFREGKNAEQLAPRTRTRREERRAQAVAALAGSAPAVQVVAVRSGAAGDICVPLLRVRGVELLDDHLASFRLCRKGARAPRVPRAKPRNFSERKSAAPLRNL